MQKLRWDDDGLKIDNNPVNIGDVAKNDGLAKGDLYDFLQYDKDMALIHFSKFRYEKRCSK